MPKIMRKKDRKIERKRERPYYTCTQLPLPATEMEAFPQGRPTSARVTDVPRTIPSQRGAPLVQGRVLSHVCQLWADWTSLREGNGYRGSLGMLYSF